MKNDLYEFFFSSNLCFHYLRDIETFIFAFYNTLIVEIFKSTGEETFSDEIHQRILSVVKKLVNQFEESSKIVSLFLKQDEIKTMLKNFIRPMI